MAFGAINLSVLCDFTIYVDASILVVSAEEAGEGSFVLNKGKHCEILRLTVYVCSVVFDARVYRCGSKTVAPSGVRKNATSRHSRTVSARSSTVSCNRLTALSTQDITILTATRGTLNSPVRSLQRRFRGV